MLVLDDLVVAYGSVEALHGVSLRVEEGEIVTLIGSNGAGKSTTLRAVSGLLRPRRGRVLFRGEEITGVRADRIVARGVSHVPEGRRIFTHLTVLENLEMGAWCVRDRKRSAATLERVFALFPRLRERAGQPGGTLSGGEQQMLAIGRALMGEPSLLLLDEPSLGIAPILVQGIFREIVSVNRSLGTTILLVEQNAHVALKHANRGYVLETGRVVLEAPAEDLLRDPQVKEAYLG